MTVKPRRWYQFSILAALALTTVVALVVAMFVVPAQRQRAAVAQILAVGGQVTYEHEKVGPAVAGIGPSPPPGPAWLRNLIGADYFHTVVGVAILNNTHRPEDVDEALAAAAWLPKLEWLHVDCAAFHNEHVEQIVKLRALPNVTIAGAEIARLAQLRKLQGLYIVGDFTGVELAPLAGLTELERLIISGPLTGEGVDAIARIHQLKSLILLGPVADADMPRLASLTRLNELHCATGRVTRALAEISDCEFVDVSPLDAIEFLSQRHEITFRFDEVAIAAGGIDLASMTLTATLSGITLGQLLTQLLAPEGLGYRIENDVLVITTLEEARRAHAGIEELNRLLPNLKTVEVGW